jgi:transposase
MPLYSAYDNTFYRQRHRIVKMLGRLKDWRKIAMHYDRCAHTFFSAICLAATVIFYLN